MKAIVLGAGVDGLVAARCLMSRGWQVTVVEPSGRVGGLAAGWEFAGQQVSVLSDAGAVAPEVILDVGLQFDRRPERPAISLPDGLVLDEGAGLGADADAYRQWLSWLGKQERIARDLLGARAPAIGADASLWPLAKLGWGVRRLGRDEMGELMRVAVRSVRDVFREHFEAEGVRAALASEIMVPAWMGPFSPHTVAMWWLGRLHQRAWVPGGPAAVVDELASGVAVKHVPIEQIVVNRGRATGVRFGGSEVAADAVVCAADVGRWRRWLPPLQVPASIATASRAFRCRSTVAKLHVKLSEVPWPAGLRTARTLVSLERCFDAAKHGRLPDAVELEGRVQGDVVSCWVYGVPSELDEAGRVGVVSLAGEALSRMGGGEILESELLLASDVEQATGVSGGHPREGEWALDQLWTGRPSAALSRLETPIEGLFHASGATHPGHPMSGLAGLQVAKRVAGERV